MRTILKGVSWTVFLTFVSISCEPRQFLSREYSEVHMAMPVRIVLYERDEAVARAAAQKAFGRIAELENALSDYRVQGELRHLENEATRWVPVSAYLFHVMSLALEVARASDGAFDPTVGPIVRLWRESRATLVLPSARALDSARALVGWRMVQLDSSARAIKLDAAGMRLDLGGIAKGYILQQALIAMAESGVTRALIEAGGDIVVGDAPPGRPGWAVELPEGVDDKKFRARATRLVNAALATSGPSQQFVEIEGVLYSHVVDPKTGLGLINGASAHVISEDAALADALATALTVLGVEGARELLLRYPSVSAGTRRADRNQGGG